ncbi:carbohydrate kinase family protein [Alsobacter sp. R-9]
MILVCGEALVDVFVGDPEGPSGARLPAEIVAGGSPFNVALGLARLGAPAAFLGGLSTDRFGELLAGLLGREGVDLSLAPVKPNATTMSVVARGADGHPRYAFYGDNAADRVFSAADLPATLPDAVRVITMGSYTLSVQPVGDAYLALAERERTRRAISLDPNLRPTLIGDLDRWAERFDRFAATAAIIKSSDEDIAVAYGGRLTVADAAARWQAAGAGLVVVTRGADGAVAFPRGEAPLEVPGRRVAVIDTVGAGDTFHAALLADLDRAAALRPGAAPAVSRERLGEALRYAVTASSITCSRRGADLPRAAEVAAALA